MMKGGKKDNGEWPDGCVDVNEILLSELPNDTPLRSANDHKRLSSCPYWRLSKPEQRLSGLSKKTFSLLVGSELVQKVRRCMLVVVEDERPQPVVRWLS